MPKSSKSSSKKPVQLVTQGSTADNAENSAPTVLIDDVGCFEQGLETGDLSAFRLVRCQLSPVENVPSSTFHLRFTLACGVGSLVGRDAQYEVQLRQCIVQLATKGCRADLTDAYSYELPEEALAEINSSHMESSESGKSSVDLSMNAGIDVISRLKATLKGSLMRSNALESRYGKDTKGKRRILLIGCDGDHWTVGDDRYGDPRNEGSLLRERYFNENPNKPLCAIDVDPGVTQALITVDVRAKLGQLEVDVLDAMGRSTRKMRSNDVDDVADALKRRIKGMALSKYLRNEQLSSLPTLPPAEFVLTGAYVSAMLPHYK